MKCKTLKVQMKKIYKVADKNLKNKNNSKIIII